MTEYAILAHPGHNRIYFDNTQTLLLQEFRAVAEQNSKWFSDIEIRTIGGIPYFFFRSDEALPAQALATVHRLSFFYALYERRQFNDRAALLPVEMPDSFYFPEYLSSLLKYSGKTNERFTRCMVNLALSCCETGNQGVIRLFDPLCGKGTTLYEGLINGFDVGGVEISHPWWQETKTYIVKFLENGRYKHKSSSETVSNAKGKKIADVFALQMANNKSDYDRGNVRTMRLVNGDTLQASSFFTKASFDLLVADLPYGVQHMGKKMQMGSDNAAVDNLRLLDQSLPGWVKLMKPGGAAALSFNEYTLKKADVVAVLEKHGLSVKLKEPYADFQHRVDQGIKRDLVVAVKPG